MCSGGSGRLAGQAFQLLLLLSWNSPLSTQRCACLDSLVILLASHPTRSAALLPVVAALQTISDVSSLEAHFEVFTSQLRALQSDVAAATSSSAEAGQQAAGAADAAAALEQQVGAGVPGLVAFAVTVSTLLTLKCA